MCDYEVKHSHEVKHSYEVKQCIVCQVDMPKKMIGGKRLETNSEYNNRQTCSTKCGYAFREIMRGSRSMPDHMKPKRPNKPIDRFILGVH